MAREALEVLKECEAFLEGHFLLSSGRHSGAYCQMAFLQQYPDKAAEVMAPVAEKLKELNIEGLDEVLNGPSAFAFGMNDPVSPAKIINDFIVKKKSEAIEIKAGLLGNELMSMEQIKALAEMPSREVLLARLVGSLQSSIASFVRVLDAIAKKDSEAAPEA